MPAGNQLVVDRAVREYVAQSVDFRTRELLWRHVDQRAQEVALLRQPGCLGVACDARSAEIHGGVRRMLL